MHELLTTVKKLADMKLTNAQIKKDVKEKLTIQSTGNPCGEVPRTHIQGLLAFLPCIITYSLLIIPSVLANSAVASLLCLLSAYQLSHPKENQMTTSCYPFGADLYMVGIIANYACVAADTFSSELGILSPSQPRLITSRNLRKVPKGTNGGVTLFGLLAGLLGSAIIVTTAVLFLPFCGGNATLRILSGASPDSPYGGISPGQEWDLPRIWHFAFWLTIWGALGSVVDSLLGGFLQQSVVDTRSGRVVEGEGGKRVLVSKGGSGSMNLKTRAEVKAKLIQGREGKGAIAKPTEGGEEQMDGRIEEEMEEDVSGLDRYDAKRKMRKPSFGDGEPTRRVENGVSLLDNNEVNFLMSLVMSLQAMVIAGRVWDIPLRLFPF